MGRFTHNETEQTWENSAQKKKNRKEWKKEKTWMKHKYYIEQRKVDLKEYIIAWFLLFEV